MNEPEALPETTAQPGAKPVGDPASKDPAKARFIAITLIRMSGAVFVLLGVLITERRIDLPWIVGVALALVGVFDVFVMPRLLARKWRSPK